MCFLRSILFIFIWFGWTLLWGLFASPILFFPFNQKLILNAGRLWARVTLITLKFICGITSNVVGIGNIPKVPFIVAAKHQSAWETIFFLILFENPVFIIKRELTKIPIYGWYLEKMSMISIDRSSGINSLKQIKAGVEDAIKNNRTIIIFPEGTRVAPGKKIKLKSGIKFLSESFPNVPIVPVALNSGLYWVNKSLVKKSGTITVEIFPQFNYKENFLSELEILLNTYV
jgi:1-acyl-sn-glycerol-3-phosphate acyltransferase